MIEVITVQKKFIIIMITLVSTFSIALACDYMQKTMKASVANYQSGGEVTGRIGYKGVLPNGTNGAMKKGDSVLFNETSPEGDPLAWRLIQSGSSNASNPGSYTLDSTVFPGFTMSDGPAITYPSSTWHVMNSRVWGPVIWGTGILYRDSNVRTVLDQLNSTVANNAVENALIKDRLVYKNYRAESTGASLENFIDYSENRIFVYHSAYELSWGYGSQPSGLGLTSADITVNNCDVYWGTIRFSTLDMQHMVTCATGAYTDPRHNVNTSHYYRFGTFLDLSNVVFAISKGTANEIAKVKEPVFTTGDLIKNAVGEDMKLRLYDSALTVNFNSIKNQNGNVVSKIIANSTVKLNADANNGTDARGNPYTLSVLVFNQSGELKYYKPLESAKGNGDYTFDTTGIPIGSYKIAIVNEAYSDNDSTPAGSSLISDYKSLEIVKQHSISYTATPQSGASGGNEYEFNKNVNAGQVIGKVTVNSQGVMPLTYSVESNGDNTYQNFEIDGLNSQGSSNNTSLNVKIKSTAPDLSNGGLKAGTYKFCINSVDANGAPKTATTDTKVCTSFTVAKTKLNVAFDDPNTTKKSMTDAATAWSETATATPNTGVKITYSKTGGFSSLIEIDQNTGQVTYNGNNAFNKVTIRATADDDPTTGNDNYDPVYVEKEIVIYRGVNGTLTPDTNSSDTTTPTFTASQANVKGNGVIGTVQGTEGTPDTIGGTQTTYRYEIINGQDSGMFQITTGSNKGTIKVKAGSELGVGSYHFTVRVSDNWSSKDVAVTVNVGVAGAENLQFYETTAAINMISQKSVTATETGVTVFATVKGSTNTNPVKYKIKDGSTNVIEINENTGAITIHGVGTVTILAEKQGGIGQASATAELTFTVTAGAQKFIYTDNAGNELPKAGSIYNAYVQAYAPSKSFQLYTAGNPAGSTVTYQLKAGSPTDVISVDASGLVTILNASQNSQMGKVIVQATSHDPTGNYADKTIELPINIEKGTRVITFAENPIYVVNGKGKVEPVIEVDGVVDTSGDVLIEVDNKEDHTIAWTNDNKVIDYNYSGKTGKDIKIHATKQMDRNYKASEADGTIHIMGPDENVLAITSPGQIIYGDHFTIRSSQYDADSTNVQYKFEIDDTTYISNPTVTGNKAEFDALKNSGSKKTTITVTRTADGESPLSKKVQVTVLPKPIEIKIDDKEKYKGEVNPALTYQDFKNQLVSWDGVQDVIQENDIKLSTTAKTNSNAGNYPIKGDATTLNKTYPNYSFTFKEGTLKIKEDVIQDDWYHLEINDGNNTAYTGKWTNQDVNIISDHNEYKNMNHQYIASLMKTPLLFDTRNIIKKQEGSGLTIINYGNLFQFKK